MSKDIFEVDVTDQFVSGAYVHALEQLGDGSRTPVQTVEKISSLYDLPYELGHKIVAAAGVDLLDLRSL